jgi:hypothetical protein
VAEKESLIEPPLPEPLDMERHGHDHVDFSDQANTVSHPVSQRFSQGSAGAVLELVNRFA